MPSLRELQAHLRELCRDHKIRHYQDQKTFRTEGAEISERWFQTRPVRSTAVYANALHEIGHIVTRTAHHPLLAREAAAWRWAKGAALVWTPSMQRSMLRGLQSYLQKALVDHQRALPGTLRLPPRDHVFWELVSPLPEAQEVLQRKLPAWLNSEAAVIPWANILSDPNRPRCSNCALWRHIATFDQVELKEKQHIGVCLHIKRPLGVENTPGGAFCGTPWIRR